MENVIDAFSKKHGLSIDIGPPSNSEDFLMTIGTMDSKKIPYHVEVKEKFYPAALVSLERKAYNIDGNLLLITTYVSPGLAESLRKKNIQFIDSCGNAYVEGSGLYIFVNKQIKTPAYRQRREQSSSLFQPSGLKVIYICLADIISQNNSNLRSYAINNLKALSATAGVSLGSASNTRNQLLAKEYAIKTSSGIELTNKESLLKKWVNAYKERLRPKLLIGTFQENHPLRRNDIVLNDKDQFLGGRNGGGKAHKISLSGNNHGLCM